MSFLQKTTSLNDQKRAAYLRQAHSLGQQSSYKANDPRNLQSALSGAPKQDTSAYDQAVQTSRGYTTGAQNAIGALQANPIQAGQSPSASRIANVRSQLQGIQSGLAASGNAELGQYGNMTQGLDTEARIMGSASRFQNPAGYSPAPGIVTRRGVTSVVGQPTDSPFLDASQARRAAAQAKWDSEDHSLKNVVMGISDTRRAELGGVSDPELFGQYKQRLADRRAAVPEKLAQIRAQKEAQQLARQEAAARNPMNNPLLRQAIAQGDMRAATALYQAIAGNSIEQQRIMQAGKLGERHLDNEGRQIDQTGAYQQGSLANQGREIDQTGAYQQGLVANQGRQIDQTGAYQQGSLANQGREIDQTGAYQQGLVANQGRQIDQTGAYQQGSLANQKAEIEQRGELGERGLDNEAKQIENAYAIDTARLAQGEAAQKWEETRTAQYLALERDRLLQDRTISDADREVRIKQLDQDSDLRQKQYELDVENSKVRNSAVVAETDRAASETEARNRLTGAQTGLTAAEQSAKEAEAKVIAESNTPEAIERRRQSELMQNSPAFADEMGMIESERIRRIQEGAGAPVSQSPQSVESAGRNLDRLVPRASAVLGQDANSLGPEDLMDAILGRQNLSPSDLGMLGDYARNRSVGDAEWRPPSPDPGMFGRPEEALAGTELYDAIMSGQPLTPAVIDGIRNRQEQRRQQYIDRAGARFRIGNLW